MFSYISFSKFNHKIDISRLSEEKTDDCLTKISEWIEHKWGYLRNYPGLEKRKMMTQSLAHEIFLVKYAGQLIGMLRICDYGPTVNVKELTHLYVDESFRHSGIGGRLVEIAKNIARSQGSELILLDTLSPKLNKFYEKHGATEIGENRFLGAPSTRMSIKLTR